MRRSTGTGSMTSEPYILRTRDGGQDWSRITSGLPSEGGPNSVNVVREDPVRRGLLFAGTERSALCLVR